MPSGWGFARRSSSTNRNSTRSDMLSDRKKAPADEDITASKAAKRPADFVEFEISARRQISQTSFSQLSEFRIVSHLSGKGLALVIS